MQKVLFIASILTAVLALVFVGIAGERAVASSQTTHAIKTINCDLNGDNVSPISLTQQSERLEANVEVLRSQKSSRNFWVGLGIAMSMLVASSLGMLRERHEERQSKAELESN